MPPEASAALWTSIVSQGPVVIVLAVAGYWLAGKVSKHIEAQNQGQRELIEALNEERTARIAAIEERSKACEADRKQLWEQLMRLHQ